MIHINKFIDKIKAVEAKGNTTAQFPMTLREARDLHSDITKLLLHLQQMQENKPESEGTIEIEISGEKW